MTHSESRAVSAAKIVGPVLVAAALAALLVRIGYRLIVDATAAIYYNADTRIPEAVDGARVYALIWGVGLGVVGYVAYWFGIVRFRRGSLRVAAAALVVLDLSLVMVLGARGGAGNFVVTVLVSGLVGLAALLAWHRPIVGGIVLLVVGLLGTYAMLLGSATYEGEAEGLLFDEDAFFILTLGLVPVLAALLSLAAAVEDALRRYLHQRWEGRQRSAMALATGRSNLTRNDPCWCGSGKKLKRCHGA